MRFTITVLFAYISVFCFAQNDDANKFPQGHWSFFTPELGYAELLILDSTTVFFNSDVGDGVRGRTIKAFVLVEKLPKTLSFPDTFFYRIVNENQLVTNWFLTEVLMTRLPKEVLNYTDYDCSFEMSRRDFGTFLESQFYGRMAKNSRYYPPQWWYFPLQETAPPLNQNELVEFLADELSDRNTHPYTTIAFLDAQILRKNATQKKAPKLVEISWNADSTLVNIAIDLTEHCYADFKDRQCYINKKEQLELNYETWDNGCTDLCEMRLYFQLMVGNTAIKSILLNGVLVEN